MHPIMLETYQGSPHVFENHSFMVEENFNLGGKDVKQGINIVRFSNHIPPFEQGEYVITRITMNHINHNSYKINQTQDKVGVFASIISTKVSSKGIGIKYVGNDITKIVTFF